MWGQRRRALLSIEHKVFDMNSRTFQMLHINIEQTVVITLNTKRRSNAVLMFGTRSRQ